MCVAYLALAAHPEYPFVLALNRDEYFARPTAAAAPRREGMEIVVSGRDLVGNGSWLGITYSGKLALLTNFRDPGRFQTGKKSRGLLVTDYLVGEEEPRAYLERLRKSRNDYNGYNLVVGGASGFFHYSSVNDSITPFGMGVHGLSNGDWEEPWPKVTVGSRHLEDLLTRLGPAELPPALFALLADRTLADKAELPSTGVPPEIEHKLSSIFVSIPEQKYGTRSSTIILVHKSGRVLFSERQYNDKGEVEAESNHPFQLGSKEL